MALWSAEAYSPLKFDPRLAPDKAANGTVFLYKTFYECSDWPTFMSWFFTHHGDKYFPQKMGASIYLPTHRSGPKYAGVDHDATTKENFTFLDRNDISSSGGVRRFKLPSTIYLPIWRTKAGLYVFMNTDGECIDDDDVVIYSDSAEAIRECMTHIFSHRGKMQEYEEELKRSGKGGNGERKILDILADGDFNQKSNGINPKKTFDTLFFTQKAEVMRLLRGFKEGNLFGAHMPIDNKLGFLLYGPPGTGKTGFIAAVANYLGRDVVNVDTARIKTRKALDNALEMDIKKYIFVFEEFDTMPGVGRRDDEDGGSEAGGEGAGKGGDMAQMAMMLMTQQKKEGGGDFMDEMREERKAAADKLDLGYLLRKLDGLESGDGRIIIATTNHPERIDPALLRPGRFGLQLHLTRCTRKMLEEMIQMIYRVEDPERREKMNEALEKVPELKWAPAEILQLGVTLEEPEAMIAHLQEKEPACFR
jgi:hypothetical protein